MAAPTSFDCVNIRNFNFFKMNGSGISSVEAGKCPCKDLKTCLMINQDSNKDIANNEDGISNDNSLDKTSDFRTLDERILNVFKDLIMLKTSYIANAVLDIEDLIMIAVKNSQLNPLKMKDLHDYEDHTIKDKLRPLKEKMLISLQNQLNWKMTTYDFDLLPG